jgi:hypothetical protein
MESTCFPHTVQNLEKSCFSRATIETVMLENESVNCLSGAVQSNQFTFLAQVRFLANHGSRSITFESA